MQVDKKTFYFAGKIYPNCWRHAIVSELSDLDIDRTWPILDAAVFKRHNYSGPFFRTEGHALCHGENSHGAINTFYEKCDRHGVFDDNMPIDERSRKEIIRNCLSAIENSDILFCWIDDMTCYGSLAEIAYARSIGKSVWIGISSTLQSNWMDMWFVIMGFSDRCLSGPDAKSVLTKMCVDSGLIPDQSKLPEVNTTFSGWMSLPDGKEKRNAYYCSEEWDELRSMVIERADGMCEQCGMHDIYAVHHLTYVRLYREKLEDLQGLCEECHERKHRSRRRFA